MLLAGVIARELMPFHRSAWITTLVVRRGLNPTPQKMENNLA